MITLMQVLFTHMYCKWQYSVYRCVRRVFCVVLKQIFSKVVSSIKDTSFGMLQNKLTI